MTKHQITNKNQAPKFNNQTFFNLENWNLGFVWNLNFEICKLTTERSF